MNATQVITLTKTEEDYMKRKRWTILDVDESVISQVKKFAMENGYTTGGALKELIKRALHGKKQ